MNFLKARLAGERRRSGAGPAARSTPGVVDTADMLVGLRPEHFVVEGPADISFGFHVDVVENLGGTRYLYGTTTSGEVVDRRSARALHLKPGADIRIGAPTGRALLFAPAGARLRTAA